MKKAIIATLVIGGMAIPGCKQKEGEPAFEQPEIKKELKPVDFIPPADSSISVHQMKSWIACNPLLDSLTIMYADSFKTEDPSQRMRYQEIFSTAQDRICVLSGLQGGYREYKWVLKNVGNPRNRQILDSVNAGIY